MLSPRRVGLWSALLGLGLGLVLGAAPWLWATWGPVQVREDGQLITVRLDQWPATVRIWVTWSDGAVPGAVTCYPRNEQQTQWACARVSAGLRQQF